MTEDKSRKKVEFPHVLIIMIILILVFCLLSYILPAGVFDKDSKTGEIIPGSYHLVEKNPISPLDALFMLYDGIKNSGIMFALIMIMGGMINMIISTGAVERIIDYSIYKLKDKSLTVLVPIIMILISLLGTLAGNDAMITFIIIGLVLVSRLKLDRICAMSIFYLPYITGQAVGPTTGIILTAQEVAGVKPLSGLGVRVIMWIVFTAFCIFYTLRYCKKILKNPNKSVMGEIETHSDSKDINKVEVLKMSDIFSTSLMIIPFLVYAIGAVISNWGLSELVGIAFATCIVVALINKWSPNEFASRFMKGSGDMGGVCMLVGFGATAGAVLTQSNIINTISNFAISIIEGFGPIGSALGLFIFTLLFNLLMPNGFAKIPILLPLFIPIADVLGITREMMTFSFQLGDGLTNFITPMSTVLASGLMLAKVNYSQWMRYILPYFGILVIISCFAISTLMASGIM